MSQLNGYLEALLPKTITVLGFSLKPFSLGHLNLIQRLQCATFINGFQKTPESIVKYTNDFLTTVLVCAMTFEEAKDAFENDTIILQEKIRNKDGTFTERFNKASFTDYAAKWNKALIKACKKKDVNILQEMERLKQYIKSAFAGPDSYPIESDHSAGYKSGAPWEQSLREFLITKYSESEAMNLPLALAFWEWAKEAEKNRQVGIKTEEDINAVNILREMAT